VVKGRKEKKKANPLFVSEPRSFRVGGAIRVRGGGRAAQASTPALLLL
jgi:hypothetical protein